LSKHGGPRSRLNAVVWQPSTLLLSAVDERDRDTGSVISAIVRYEMPNPSLDELLQSLREIRIRRKISLEAVATRGELGNESNVRRLERPGSNPTLRTVQKYAEAIGVSLKVSLENMRVLTFFNHAGGVGKSSTVRDLGVLLAEQGFRVLVIDADPQANLTRWLGIRNKVAVTQTIYSAVIGDVDGLRLPQPLRVHGVDLIPSSLDIARIEPQLMGITMGVTRLRNVIRRLEGYDFVLIDPPPSLGQLSAISVIAADAVVVPLPTNSKGLEGLDTVFTMIREYRQAAPGLSIAMFALTQYDARTNHDRESLASIRTHLESVAPVSSPLRYLPAAYKDAQVNGVPIPFGDKGGKADADIRRVSLELIEALGVGVRLDTAIEVEA
jgi:chromosome partitioning protein